MRTFFGVMLAAVAVNSAWAQPAPLIPSSQQMREQHEERLGINRPEPPPLSETRPVFPARPAPDTEFTAPSYPDDATPPKPRITHGTPKKRHKPLPRAVHK